MQVKLRHCVRTGTIHSRLFHTAKSSFAEQSENQPSPPTDLISTDSLFKLISAKLDWPNSKLVCWPSYISIIRPPLTWAITARVQIRLDTPKCEMAWKHSDVYTVICFMLWCEFTRTRDVKTQSFSFIGFQEKWILSTDWYAVFCCDQPSFVIQPAYRRQFIHWLEELLLFHWWSEPPATKKSIKFERSTKRSAWSQMKKVISKENVECGNFSLCCWRQEGKDGETATLTSSRPK